MFLFHLAGVLRCFNDQPTLTAASLSRMLFIYFNRSLISIFIVLKWFQYTLKLTL